MHHFLVVAVIRLVVQWQPFEQMGFAVVIVVADLSGRKIDIDAAVPSRIPSFDVRGTSSARIKARQGSNKIIALAIGFILFFGFCHGIVPHRSASWYSSTIELIDRFITDPVTVLPINLPYPSVLV